MLRKIKAFFTSRAKLAELLTQVEALKGQRFGQKYIELESYEESDPHYVESLARIAVDPAFRFFLYDYREAIVEKIEKAGAVDEAIRAEACSELKAIGRLRVYLEAKANQHLRILEQRKSA